MADLIDTTEMYLRTILECEEEDIVPLRARISERLGHSGPTVSQTVSRMQRDGLVVVSDDRHLELTETGRIKAVQVMRKHRLAERLLADVIGLEWEYVHEEACRWEHVISEHVERKMLSLLNNPVESPYGNPIPGLDELGVRSVIGLQNGVTSVTALFEHIDQTVTARLRRIAEPAQVDPELLRMLDAAQLKPGAVANFTHKGEFVLIETKNVEPDDPLIQTIELPFEVAANLFVSQ